MDRLRPPVRYSVTACLLVLCLLFTIFTFLMPWVTVHVLDVKLTGGVSGADFAFGVTLPTEIIPVTASNLLEPLGYLASMEDKLSRGAEWLWIFLGLMAAGLCLSVVSLVQPGNRRRWLMNSTAIFSALAAASITVAEMAHGAACPEVYRQYFGLATAATGSKWLGWQFAYRGLSFQATPWVYLTMLGAAVAAVTAVMAIRLDRGPSDHACA